MPTNKRINQKRVGAILQYCQIILNILISLIYTPIMLRILGQNEYGIYSVASSTISFLSLLSLGLGGSYLRYYSIYKKDNDEEGISRLNGLYLFVFSVIGLISLALGLTLAFNVGLIFNESYSSSDINIARVLMIILSINLAISFPASVFSSYITSQEKFVFQKIVNMLTTVLGPCTCIILLFCGFASIGMVVASLLFTILTAVINIYYSVFKLKMRISYKKIDFRLLKDIFVFSVFIALNQIIEQINWQTDKIILGKIIGGSSVAIYAVGSQINMLFVQFSTAVSGVFAPRVNMIVQKNEKNMDEQLSDLFILVGRIQWFVLFLILSGFAFFGKYFVYRWAGEGYDNSYYVALLLMTPAIVALIQNVGIEIQRAKNKHQVRSIVYFAIAVLNVLISILFAMLWGEIGCALGTTISLILGPILFMNIYYQKKLNIDVKRFWKEIGKTLPGMILPLTYGVLILLLHKFASFVDFGILIVAYTAIYFLSVYMMSLNSTEKGYISSIILFFSKNK